MIEVKESEKKEQMHCPSLMDLTNECLCVREGEREREREKEWKKGKKWLE